MSVKLPAINGKKVVKALERYGYKVIRIRGSHHFMSGEGKQSVSVPVHAGRDIKKGTLSSILSDAGLTNEDFIALL